MSLELHEGGIHAVTEYMPDRPVMRKVLGPA